MGECAICGGPVRESRRRYCSRTCYGLARRKRETVPCRRCGAPFEVRPYEAARAREHLCPDCKAGWKKRAGRARLSSRIWLDCFTCGAPVERPLWRSRRSLYTFCSPACRSVGWASLLAAYEGLRPAPGR